MIREMLGIAEGILQDLHDDHNEVAALIERIKACDNGAERSRLFKEMSTKLLAHAHAEQEILYARMKNSAHEESRQFAIEGASEHQLVEEQVGRVNGIGAPMSDSWIAELKVLEDLIEHHVSEEEDEGFAYARKDFDKDQFEAMGQQFQVRKREFMAGV